MATILRITLEIIAALIVIIVLALIATAKTRTRPFVDTNGAVIKDSIAEELYLPLGGVKQWVLLRGRTIHNPILIFLHGGPGISLHALFRYFHHELEDHFIVVGWDQRGAGKSYRKAISEESMTIETFIEDLHELIQYLKTRFHQDNVYLVGESWGSLLGTLYAHKYPDDVAAYIGTGQVSDMHESERLGYEFMLAQAEKQNNGKALKELRNIKQPPFSRLEDISVLRKWLMKFGGCLYNQTSYLPWIFKMLTVDEYAWPDVLKIGLGSKRSLRLLHQELFSTNLFTQIPELKVPVYFLLGKHDKQTSSSLAAKYFENLKAPKKELVWFYYSGHNPMFEEPARFKNVLLAIRYHAPNIQTDAFGENI